MTDQKKQITKEEVFNVLKEHILDQLEDEVEESEIEISKSMLDLGANSLDIVEIISNTMRELKVKVPRDVLSKINNMNDLCQTIADYKNNAS